MHAAAFMQPHAYAAVTLAITNNTLPEDGVTTPKHVGAILM